MPDTESPIEDIFEHAFYKHALPDLQLERQREFVTQIGKFRVDFVLPFEGYLIGFECDGLEYHNIGDDEIRDAALLGEGHLGTMYHLPGRELWYEPGYAIEFIATRDSLFPDRTLSVVRRQIETNSIQTSSYLRRWSRVSPMAPREFWICLYGHILEWNCDSIADYKAKERVHYKW